jgi:hypothetical protein
MRIEYSPEILKPVVALSPKSTIHSSLSLLELIAFHHF